MKAINAVVADVEKVLKIISDDLMSDKCSRYTTVHVSLKLDMFVLGCVLAVPILLGVHFSK